MQTFLDRFAFSPEGRGLVGIEREFFLTRDGIPVPEATEFLLLANDPAWTYELSACQVEHRTKPHRDEAVLEAELRESEAFGRRIAGILNAELSSIEVAPADMTLAVYPAERYRKLSERLPKPILSAACRVAGTHIHVGVGSIEEAVETYNALVKHVQAFMHMGDHSHGLRLHLYAEMAGECMPEPYASPVQFYERSRERGIADDPRSCYDLIRISMHGTVEIRAFGVPKDVDELMDWVRAVRGVLP